MKYLSIVMSASILLSSGLTAEAQTTGPASTGLRITELLPDLSLTLAIEPAIPADFVAMSPSGTPHVADWIYWGPRPVLEAYFKNPNNLSQAVIRAKLSTNVAQTGQKNFNRGTDLMLHLVKTGQIPGITYQEKFWGTYPVFSVQQIDPAGQLFAAWIGLNDPQGGATLLCNLVVPSQRDLNPEEKALWHNFLNDTHPLEGQDFFKAYGQDMYTGYTIATIADKQLKISAEKRRSDGKIQVIVTPLSSGVRFRNMGWQEGRMGARWRYGDPLLKVRGVTTAGSNIVEQTLSIFLQTVDDFTPPRGELRANKDYFVYHKP